MKSYRRKKSFLLLEVIIGIALFALCALPLIRQPFHLTQKSCEKLIEAELFRLAEVTHCETLAQLEGGQVPWDSLPKKIRGRLSLPRVPCQVRLGEHMSKNFIQTTIIKLKTKKQISADQEARFLEFIIAYTPKNGKKGHRFSYLHTALYPHPAQKEDPLSSG
jgi:hypothetical protein